MDVIAECAFGIQTHAQTGQNDVILEHIKSFFSQLEEKPSLFHLAGMQLVFITCEQHFDNNNQNIKSKIC